MNYKESRIYIQNAQKYGSILGLENMREMLRRLGNPQDALRYVHVAGTNGKGSVLAYISTVLTHAGYKVGRYISPTIYSYLERMDVCGNPVSEEAFARNLTKVAEVIQGMQADGLPHPTPFEIETAVAFLYFKEEDCDIVALETGLGGRTDATNIVTTTLLSVLTPISIDHVGFLGNSLNEIAYVKAGIIKPGCQVVSAVQKPQAQEVIEKECRLQQVPLTVVGEVTAKECNLWEQNFLYEGEEYTIHLSGLYQLENAAIALEALKKLNTLGYPMTPAQVKEGMAKTKWGGRFSMICKKPVFVIDGAHNPDAAYRLTESIREYFADKKITYIMGVFKDKEYEKVIRITAPYAKEIFTVATPNHERALPAKELAETVRKYHKQVTPMNSLEQAVDTAWEKAGEDGVIIAFGSLSFLGDITRIAEKKQEEPLHGSFED